MITGRTPVLVGAAAVQQRHDDPSRDDDAATLMVRAVERAVSDAGPGALLARAGLVAVPTGTWPYRDAARIVAERVGARGARTARYEIGLLQQTLVADACRAIAEQGLDVAVLCGGEAKYRALRASILGVELPDAAASAEAVAEPTEPDDVVVPADDILHPVEIARMLAVPARQYAVIDTALRAADGVTVAEHARELARLWAASSEVAQANPDAWNREPVGEEALLGNRANPMLATPYTKLHCSQWNVNQAAALILCSVDAARDLGVPEHRWVYPHALVESNFMTPLVTRSAMHRNPAMWVVGERLRARTGTAPADCELLDLYSCFPSAVRLQLRELAIDSARQLTVTGGMTFGGGPLNNYTFQSLAKMCALCASNPRRTGSSPR